MLVYELADYNMHACLYIQRWWTLAGYIHEADWILHYTREVALVNEC